MTMGGVTTPRLDDDRARPPFMASDRASLDSWLEFYRSTLPLKIGGLTPEQLCRRAIPPSTLTLLGIVRHLTKVERYWFGNVVAGLDQPRLYCEADPEGDFAGGRLETALADLDRYYAEVASARETGSATRSGCGSAGKAQRRGHQPALGPGAHDRGVRAPSRARRPAPRVHRRTHRLLTDVSRPSRRFSSRTGDRAPRAPRSCDRSRRSDGRRCRGGT